jgi:hypothetical protein
VHTIHQQYLDQGSALRRRRRRWRSEQAIGRSRGGRATKIHGVADSQRRLFRFTLTAGNIADITAAHELAAKLPSNGCLIADMGYDATKLRVDLAFRGTATVIPTNPTHQHQ